MLNKKSQTVAEVTKQTKNKNLNLNWEHAQKYPQT